ncbi:hypothetical protein [Peribacillus asahii]|uniref:hypothetical protein n=1 Tax=Peribacillus asahii TaxID=228899 RepID=UPI00380D7FB9
MNRSTFPEQIDQFTTLYDLPPDLVAKAKRYQELKMKPTLTSVEQTELNGLTTELSSYIISPEVFNKLSDAMVNMETFLTQQITGYIEAKQVLWDSYVKEFKHVGVHSTSQTYKFQNIVTASNGDLYLALKDVPVGIAITNTSYWQKTSSKGEKGDMGLNGYYKGDYNNAVAYGLGDAVSYEGFIYYCKLATTAGTAPTNGTHWFLWDRIIAGETEPITRQVGTVWIKITD